MTKPTDAEMIAEIDKACEFRSRLSGVMVTSGFLLDIRDRLASMTPTNAQTTPQILSEVRKNHNRFLVYTPIGNQ